jgi:hypothetical protein
VFWKAAVRLSQDKRVQVEMMVSWSLSPIEVSSCQTQTVHSLSSGFGSSQGTHFELDLFAVQKMRRH